MKLYHISDTLKLGETMKQDYKNNFELKNPELSAKQVREELSNLSAKPNPSNVPNQDDRMTIEKFSKMTMTEQKQWKDEHLDEYHEMYSQK